MKLTLLTILLAAFATADRKPSPAVDALLARAYDMADIEGECAKQACEALNSPAALCTPTKVSTYRAQCQEVMIRSGLKKTMTGEYEQLTPEVEQKLKESMAQARVMVNEGTAERFLGKDGEGNEGLNVEELLRWMGSKDEL
ncbi:hypothetical protein EJ02DRAFT_456988 [Clathrospora elynae]|uniref:Uncharacterized protein n=1 Tax=Clathrospora elynae TaxID=706981 RepID=A0A6A5SI77_9PLEO|nr:hypothetical protein EJ02DRAFT_456988 [Clathrospora elynae]